MKSFDLTYHSETRQSIGFSRAQSFESTILIKDLDSQSFAIEDKPMLSMMSRQINCQVLTQHTQQQCSNKLKISQHNNKQLKQTIYSLEDEIRRIKDSHQQQLRLKTIAEGEYVSGIKSMYERNTQLNQKIIIYERELKVALFKTCQLQKQLEQMNIKSKNRSNKQYDLESKIQRIQQKYHEKIINLQQCYEKDKFKSDGQLRQFRYQIQVLRQQLNKQRNLRTSLEATFQSKNKTISETEVQVSRLRIYQEENKTLKQQILSLKQQLYKYEIQNKIQKKVVQEKRNELTNSAIAALAIQNITLKQQQARSSKNLLALEGKMKTFQDQLYKSTNIKQSSFNHRQNYRKDRFSSVCRHIDSPSLNQQISQYDISSHSINMRPVRRQSNYMLRSQKRENINETLIRRCKQLNQSLFV